MDWISLLVTCILQPTLDHKAYLETSRKISLGGAGCNLSESLSTQSRRHSWAMSAPFRCAFNFASSLSSPKTHRMRIHEASLLKKQKLESKMSAASGLRTCFLLDSPIFMFELGSSRARTKRSSFRGEERYFGSFQHQAEEQEDECRDV